MLDPEELRRYARRDWQAPVRLGLAERVRQPVARKVAMAVELYEAARAVNPTWPDAACRRLDLAHHIRLRELLRNASDVGAR